MNRQPISLHFWAIRTEDSPFIEVNGASGYCPVDEAYNDKLTIYPDSIRYEYLPVVETETNILRKWSYKTSSPIYRKVFNDVSVAIEDIMNWEERPFCTDIAGVGFEITYSDKTKRKRSFLLPGDYFKDCFSIIKQMIPGCEYIPAVLLTSEDYSDEE